MEALHREAQEKFLARWPVIGIALGGKSGQELVFLLEQESPEVQAEILDWAQSARVAVRIVVVGKVTPLKSTK